MEFWSELFLTGALSVFVALLFGMLFSDDRPVSGAGDGAVGREDALPARNGAAGEAALGGDFCLVDAPAATDMEEEEVEEIDEASAGSSSVALIERVRVHEASTDEFGFLGGGDDLQVLTACVPAAILRERVGDDPVDAEAPNEVGTSEVGLEEGETERKCAGLGVPIEVQRIGDEDLVDGVVERLSDDFGVLSEVSQLERSEVLIQFCHFDLSAEEGNSLKDRACLLEVEEAMPPEEDEGEEIGMNMEVEEASASHGGGSEIVPQSSEVEVRCSEGPGNAVEAREEVVPARSPLIVDGDDDEWEGIERSEVEKVFGRIIAYVGSESGSIALSKLSRDLQLRLYGLHKIATEGPCHDPQPMALMITARSKWQAWQRLGNMSPEMAMEQYMNILSDNIPGWDSEKLLIDVEKQGYGQSLQVTTSGTAASVSTNQRPSKATCTPEGTSYVEVDDGVIDTQCNVPGKVDDLSLFSEGSPCQEVWLAHAKNNPEDDPTAAHLSSETAGDAETGLNSVIGCAVQGPPMR